MERLPFLAQQAEQALELRETCHIDVQWDDGEYRISGGGFEDEFEASLSLAYAALFARLHDKAMQQLPDHISIHAASLMGPRGLCLLIGEKWSGKSTLAMHLLSAGFEVVGDELVLLKDGQAVAFPRRFYIRYQSLDLLPALAGFAGDAPFVNADIHQRLLAVDPQTLGRPWHIRPAPIQTVIFLEPHHGSASAMLPSSKVDMVRHVLPQCGRPASNRKGWLADLSASINRSDTFVLHLGDLPGATEAIRQSFNKG